MSRPTESVSPPSLDIRTPPLGVPTIWWFALGYFAAYVPYSSLTKAVTSGLFENTERISGFRILPLSVFSSVVGMYAFLGAMRWFKYASHTTVAGVSLPHPSKWTFLSGMCTALIIGTTTLAYTFEGVSIVFIMLLMRGGVLVIAPVVDSLTGRKTRWFSWVGLLFSMAALIVAYMEKKGTDITLICAIDVAIYVASYFVRLQLMTHLAKSETDPGANRRYFVEEQLVATPVVLFLLAVGALFGSGGVGFLTEVRAGFLDIWDTPIWPAVIVIGICSQFTGVFGGLILLDKGENTFSVPVNRSSSIIAGVCASYALHIFFDASSPSAYKLGGAGLIICAILFLSIPPLLEKKRAKRKAEKAS